MNKICKRENFIDIARGIAICSIVFYHVETIYYPSLTQLVRPYIVPIFFFISGYLLNTNKSVMVIVKRYWKIFVGYELIAFVLNLLGAFFDPTYGLKDEITFQKVLDILTFNPTQRNMGQMWFLLANVILLVIAKVISECGRYSNIIMLITSVIFTIVNHFLGTIEFVYANFNCLNVILSCFIFTALGYLCKNRLLNFLNNKIMVVIAVLYLIICYINRPIYIDVRVNVLQNTILFYGLSLMGCYIIFAFSNILSKTKFISEILGYIGKHTLVILAFHWFVNVIARTILANYQNSIMYRFLLCLACIAIPLLMEKLFFYTKELINKKDGSK